jgi:chromosome segregation protein
MLKVERLEISGFKSFVDRVAVDFAGGVTAIVGPNGCGKSNLSEAMTWVLGEQSAKSLRGGTMEDVIFNGTDSRKPLGMAEATLTLRTDPSFPHANDGRLTIARRVFRGGESQYKLNGKTVRLKEIRDLLMDTGLGLRAYSVIEQGKIGMILSGKPQERRKLLEEAAGVTRYKARKAIAEVKLEEATANLLRLDDVISEVERSVRTLKRQASAAKRFQEKEVEYRELLEKVLLERWAVLAARLIELQTRLDGAVSREAELAAHLHRDEADNAAGRERLDELGRAVAARHQRHAELGTRVEGRQQLIKGSRETLREIGERGAQAQALAERRRAEIGHHEEALAALENRRAEQVAERDDAASAVESDERQVASADRELQLAHARLESLRRETLASATEINAVRQRAQHAQIELEKGNYRLHHLDREIEEQGAELAQAREGLELAREKVLVSEGRLGERATESERTIAALEALMRREAEATDGRRKLEDELSQSRNRQRILAELSQADAERRRNLVSALEAAGELEPRFLAEQADPLEGWERALDFYLGELADAVLLAPGHDPLALAHALAGRAEAALIAPAHRSHAQDFDPSEAPAALARITADSGVHLSVGEALGFPEDLAAALPPAFLVKSPEDARRLAATHSGVAFLCREGLWIANGTLRVEGERATPGVLERERDLAELGRAIPDLEACLARALSDLERLLADRSQMAKDSNRLQTEVGQLRQEVAVGRARAEDAAQRERRLAAEGEKLGVERTTIAADLDRVGVKGRELSSELGLAEEKQAGLAEHFDRAQAELDAAKGARESLRAESAGRRGRLDLLEERLASLNREIARLSGELETGHRQIAAWTEESDKLAERRAQIEEEVARAQIELQTALEERVLVEEQVLESQAQLDDHRQGLRLLEERIQTGREQRDTVRSEVEELRIQKVGLEHDVQHLGETHRQEFERELPDPAPQPSGALAELDVELSRCKATLDRLGPVNVLALEEHDEQEERFSFLTVQRADVVKSVESLRQTIKEINQTSAERFRETFVVVNQAFGEVFQHLFRGGEAEMRLLDEDDPLESGIEIVARPPGKRLQTLMLLSGGEKALTAIALLFALFRSKPSPFCILDEVDAPLDDINTARFADLLHQMSKQDTQFIVITHNKLTMEIAENLYGVTMEEKGVSKLVSVQMDAVQPEQQRATA